MTTMDERPTAAWKTGKARLSAALAAVGAALFFWRRRSTTQDDTDADTDGQF